jgi:hypothetical protein
MPRPVLDMEIQNPNDKLNEGYLQIRRKEFYIVGHLYGGRSKIKRMWHCWLKFPS